MQTLIYGYGNPGRQDDGLGVELVRRLEEWAVEMELVDIEFDKNYQLNIEDAEAISNKDLVIFADASQEEIEDFCLSRVDGNAKVSFTSHAASPGYVVELCKELFQKEPHVMLLHIKGYEWDIKEGISDRALDNLEKALSYMKIVLEKPDLVLKLNNKLKTC